MRFRYPTFEVSTVYLMMGFGCNFDCRHCLQDKFANSKKTGPISKETIDYIKHLVNLRPPQISKLKLIFWGGEPLVYFKTMKEAVEIFGDTVEYSMVTNGGLLTEEIVEFINEHKISVALSYDGKNTASVRGKNVLEDETIASLFKKIDNKSICAVLSAYNYDLQALFDEVEERFGSAVPVYIEPLRITWDMPEDITNIPLEDFKDKIHKLAGKAYEDILACEPSREALFFTNLLQKLIVDNKYPLMCRQIYAVVNIDLKGNIYSCHNSCTPFADTKTPRHVLCEKQTKWVEANKPEACETCFAKKICNGGCPKELRNAHERMSCEVNKVVYREAITLAHALEQSFIPVDFSEGE